MYGVEMVSECMVYFLFLCCHFLLCSLFFGNWVQLVRRRRLNPGASQSITSWSRPWITNRSAHTGVLSVTAGIYCKPLDLQRLQSHLQSSRQIHKNWGLNFFKWQVNWKRNPWRTTGRDCLAMFSVWPMPATASTMLYGRNWPVTRVALD